MAKSIDGWFADRAEGGDGPGDDEPVERQPPWDTAASTRQAGRRTARLQGADNASEHPVRRGGLPPRLERLRPLVRKFRESRPGLTAKTIRTMLAGQGFMVTVADVERIVLVLDRELAAADLLALRAAIEAGEKPRSQNGVRSWLLTEGERREVQRRAAERRRAEERAAERARKSGTKVNTSHLQVQSEAARRKVQHDGWRRADDARPVVDAPRGTDDVPIPCYACGAVPTQFGTCRCT